MAVGNGMTALSSLLLRLRSSKVFQKYSICAVEKFFKSRCIKVRNISWHLCCYAIDDAYRSVLLTLFRMAQLFELHYFSAALQAILDDLLLRMQTSLTENFKTGDPIKNLSA